MKLKLLGLEWGAAYEEAQPVQITHGQAEVVVYVTEKGDLCVHTVRSECIVRSHSGGSDLEMLVNAS